MQFTIELINKKGKTVALAPMDILGTENFGNTKTFYTTVAFESQKLWDPKQPITQIKVHALSEFGERQILTPNVGPLDPKSHKFLHYNLQLNLPISETGQYTIHALL